MNDVQLNRRQALVASGLGMLTLGSPGLVMGSDKVDASGKAVASDKSCIFVLLCGGPSHVDTWDMKPEAPLDCPHPVWWASEAPPVGPSAKGAVPPVPAEWVPPCDVSGCASEVKDPPLPAAASAMGAPPLPPAVVPPAPPSPLAPVPPVPPDPPLPAEPSAS